MAKTLASCISLTIALLAAPAGALAADVVRPSSVAASTTVPAGGSSTLTLRCPSASVALHAAVTRQGAGVTVRRSTPGAGPGDWRFRLAAADGASRRGARAVLRCVRLALPGGVSGARLVVRTRRREGIDIPAGSSTAVQMRCGEGFAGSGYGLDRGVRRDVTIAAAVPTPHGWNFRLENSGASPASAGLRVRCLKSVVSARRRGAPVRLRFRLTRPSFAFLFTSNGTGAFTHRCGTGKFSVATGSSVEPLDPVELVSSGPTSTRAGRWLFRGASAGDGGRGFLVCLGRASGFR
jgi:hypothetical protein